MFRPSHKYPITNEMKSYILHSIHTSLDKRFDKTNFKKNEMLSLDSFDLDTYHAYDDYNIKENSPIITTTYILESSFHSFCQFIKPLFRLFVKALCCYYKIPSSSSIQTLSKKE